MPLKLCEPAGVSMQNQKFPLQGNQVRGQMRLATPEQSFVRMAEPMNKPRFNQPASVRSPIVRNKTVEQQTGSFFSCVFFLHFVLGSRHLFFNML